MNPEVAAQRLRSLREANGFSQSMLAQEAHVSIPTIQRLETKPQFWETATESTIRKLARAMQVSQDYFTSDEDVEPRHVKTVPATVHNAKASSASSRMEQDDLVAILSAIGMNAKAPEVAVHKPFRADMRALPKMAHTQEGWNEQALCFLEHCREAFVSWADNDEREIDNLLTILDGEVIEWAENHGFEFEPHDDDLRDDDTPHDGDITGDKTGQVVENSQIIETDDKLYVPDKSIWGVLGASDLTKSGIARELIKPSSKISTEEAHVYLDGAVFDHINVDGHDYYILCAHTTESDRVKDHSFKLASSFR